MDLHACEIRWAQSYMSQTLQITHIFPQLINKYLYPLRVLAQLKLIFGVDEEPIQLDTRHLLCSTLHQVVWEQQVCSGLWGPFPSVCLSAPAAGQRWAPDKASQAAWLSGGFLNIHLQDSGVKVSFSLSRPVGQMIYSCDFSICVYVHIRLSRKD